MALSVNPNAEIQEDGTTTQFRQFDVVSDDSDHHYLNWNNKIGKTTNGPDCFSNASSGVYKKIMKEWKVLERNLPDSIYVRVYERRIDLLRAVIVGPAGTPYHDGLFFFDIAFPSDYPALPPMVMYRSFGLRLNPNLYATGMVCLSLLNTWYGKRTEKWNPDESTVLQVLVSIQGLVLNKDPYFNEPGVGIFPGRARKSMVYNENAFVLSCKTMVYLLRKPPKNFEGFVASHFRGRARNILAACNAYVDGRVRVGLYSENGSVCNSKSIKVSRNFKATMKYWCPEMVVAFDRAGAGNSLGNFVLQLKVENKKITTSLKGKMAKTVPLRTVVVKKAKCGISNVIRKFKKVLGLKKAGKQNV
ncbi:hypothetical protein ACSBR1_032054 [Camellia fascicularis]